MALPRNMKEDPADPSLHDEQWRRFTRDRELNSALAKHQWNRFRKGPRRLLSAYARRLPAASIRRVLAEDAFVCAVHWRKRPRVVPGALHALIKQRPGARIYRFAAAEYWKWAKRSSREDLPSAQQMIDQARKAMTTLDSLTLNNLTQMLLVVVGETGLRLSRTELPERNRLHLPHAPNFFRLETIIPEAGKPSERRNEDQTSLKHS